jgi:EmrB/QacA subfamily drug resistance transporter
MTAARPSNNARWILAAAVFGSGAAFLEGTVVNVALPAIGRDFDLGMDGLQWVITAYLLTLSALILLGGALGDRYSRVAVFRIGSIGFAFTTLGCAIAPNEWALDAARLLQGVAGAMLVPNSLAMLEDAYHGQDRAAAIGQWAAWSGVSTALGPLVGGWVVDAISWRWVFAAVIPFALLAAALTWHHTVDDANRSGSPRLDYIGAALITIGMAALIAALVEGPRVGFGRPLVLAGLVGGAALLVIFLFVERRSPNPLLPLEIFHSKEFSGANLATLLIYAALSGLLFLLMLELQNAVGYTALAAGASLLPVNVLMLVLSPRVGRLADRIGARIPMTVGALVAAAGMLLFMRVQPGARYLTSVLPAAVVFGLGLSLLVAPLTATVLGALDESRKGLASGVNNAVARLAGLLAAATLPLAAGLAGSEAAAGEALTRAFSRGMVICAVLCALGGGIAWVTVSGRRQ